MLATLACALGAALACSTPATDGRVTPKEPPNDDASFRPVADMLVHRCGSLDCHGTVYRNLRLYGREGLRRSADASPTVVVGSVTSPEEYAEDYASVVGLEPEATGQVVAEGGAAPERLTLVRKGRGQEAHKGGALMSVGDDRDRCLVSWLAGRTDTAACKSAVDPTKYP